MLRPTALLVAGLSILLAACGSSGPPEDLLARPGSKAEAPAYRIQIGDELGVKFFLNPDLNEEVVVRPDGRISLQLIPEVVAAGRTPSELVAQLKQLYSAELRDPQIAVIVRSFSAQRVYVDGEVEKPGEVPLMGPVTVLQAIATAGGLTDRAKLDEVLLIRRRPDGSPGVVPLNIERALDGSDLSHDRMLQPFDIVFVPKSGIANVNQWVDQYIRRNIPVSFGFRVEPL